MSTLVIDTIQGKTTAGSVNVRGEGSWSKQDAENMSSIASGDLA